MPELFVDSKARGCTVARHACEKAEKCEEILDMVCTH